MSCDWIYSVWWMSGYLHLRNINTVARGLNIEGNRPLSYLPSQCKWFNILQVVDTPITCNNLDTSADISANVSVNTSADTGINGNSNIEDIIHKSQSEGFDYIEEIVGINVEDLVTKLSKLILNISKDFSNPLVHVHQYTGTTKLAETLQRNTGIKAILDLENYYNTPVNYVDEYPNIDCLISISQCAGFVDPPGTFIVPTGYIEYDIDYNVIYNTTLPLNTTECNTISLPYTTECKDINKCGNTGCSYLTKYGDIRKYIDFEYVEGNILVVNDLWHPSKLSCDGVLLLDEQDIKVLDFVKKNTTMFDESHNWIHAIRVAYNSTKILNNKHVLYLALLHDVCDHKYPNSIDRSKLTEFIHDNLAEYKQIDSMIDEISFSKQSKSQRSVSDNIHGVSHSGNILNEMNDIIDAVRDGDRLEALGLVGIRRCEQFVISKNGKIPDDVITHCYDKLLKLLPCGYITTQKGKEMAKSLHNDIVQYVIDNLPLTTLNYDLPIPLR